MGRARFLVVTVALALAGCGDDDARPDYDEIVSKLADDVQEQTGTRQVVVLCQGNLAEGELCDVRAPGGLKAKVRITRLDDGDVDGEVVQP
jgi:hypothetical protein